MSRFRRVIDEGSIWVLAAPLVVWALHFLACYWVGAIWCANGWGPLVDARWLWVALTVVALGAIAWLARGARRHYGGVLVIDEQFDDDTEIGRQRFIGHVALMLSALAALAVVMTFLPTMAFPTC